LENCGGIARKSEAVKRGSGMRKIDSAIIFTDISILSVNILIAIFDLKTIE